MPAQETQTKSIVLKALAAHYACTEKLPAKDPNVRSFEAKSPELNYFFEEINNYFIHMIVQIGKSKFTSPVSVSPSDLVQTIRALDQLNRIRRLCPKGKPQWIKHYALTFASHPGSPMLQFTFSKPGLCLVRRPTAINRLRHAETTKSFEVGTLDQTIIQEIISGYNSSMRNWKAEVEKWNLQHGAALDAKMFLCRLTFISQLPALAQSATSPSRFNLLWMAARPDLEQTSGMGFFRLIGMNWPSCSSTWINFHDARPTTHQRNP